MATNEWTRETRDKFWDELKLFFTSRSSPNKDPWKTRLDDWEHHVNLEAILRRNIAETASETFKKPPIDQLKAWCDARIQILTEHLNIIENKISMLFNLNTLLLIALNVMIGMVLNIVSKPVHRTKAIELLGGSATVFGVIWVVTTVICLLAARRVVWGDLGRYRAGQNDMTIKLDSLELNQLAAAEEQHVKSMIVTVVARTNKFRIAVALIWIEVLMMFACLVIGGYIVSKSVVAP